MPKIAISYRRNDATAIAGRIFDHLSHRFGRDNVFMDIESIPLATDFAAHVERVVAAADLMVAVIGPDWIGQRTHGAPRIAESDDFVRLEIETALKHGVNIVPTLVEGTAMPREAELPESLRPMVRYNALSVDSGRDFASHVARLIELAEAIDQRTDPIGAAVGPTASRHIASDAAEAPSEPKNKPLVRDYVYVSATKVALMHAQLPNQRPASQRPGKPGLANDFDYHPGDDYKRQPFLPSRRLSQMLEDVIDHVRTSEPLGTFDRPEQYIADVLPLRFGVVFDYAAGIAFFGQRFEDGRVLALIGSHKSVIGSASHREVGDHTLHYYVLKFLGERASGWDGASRGSLYEYSRTYMEAAQTALLNIPPLTRNFEFMARLIHQQDGLVLATPIYLAAR